MDYLYSMMSLEAACPLADSAMIWVISLAWWLTHLTRITSISLSIHQTIYSSMYLSIHLFIHLSINQSIYLSIYPSVIPIISPTFSTHSISRIHPSIHQSIHLSIYIFIPLKLQLTTSRKTLMLHWMSQESLNFLRPKPPLPSSGILSVQKRHQGLKFKSSGLKKVLKPQQF